jgi:hypothetical protein
LRAKSGKYLLNDAKRLRVGDFRVIFTETTDTITVLDLGPRGGIYEEEEPMPVMTKSPKGDDIVILSRKEYDRLLAAADEDVIDAAIAKKAIARNEETLSEAEVDELLAARTPLAFWRKKRGLTQTGEGCRHRSGIPVRNRKRPQDRRCYGPSADCDRS